jgi:hypothetical protein
MRKESQENLSSQETGDGDESTRYQPNSARVNHLLTLEEDSVQRNQQNNCETVATPGLLVVWEKLARRPPQHLAQLGAVNSRDPSSGWADFWAIYSF